MLLKMQGMDCYAQERKSTNLNAKLPIFQSINESQTEPNNPES